MQAIIFAFVAYFAWGVGMAFEAIAARKIEAKSFSFWGFVLGFFLSSLYAPFVLYELKNISLGLIGFCYLIGFFILLGTIIYYQALKKGNPSLVGTIASSFPMVTVVISIVFLKEKINLFQIIATMIIFIGLVFTMLNFDEINKKKFKLNTGVFLAFLTMLCWGVYSSLIKIPISKIGWFWPNWFIFSSFPLIYLYMRFSKTTLEIPKKKDVVIFVILSILFVRIAEYAYNLGLSSGMTSIVAPIAGANPTLFVILAYFIFKEPLKKSQVIGIISTLAGVILLSAFSI